MKLIITVALTYILITHIMGMDVITGFKQAYYLTDMQ